ncbi:type II secretion system minor pseudopilin GspI [Pseudomonas aeruginosa]|uniref:type II secretion system minor pseudopilin GspI n=1 Tax=Pseudomonas aeruginosa TaxID=287 RepID=UPI003FD3503E
MSTRLSSRGFTLIEVLVALAIVAIALAAAIRAVGLMTDGNGLLRDKSLALLAAENRLAELRLLEDGAVPADSDFECSQGRLRLYCEQRVEATDDPALLWVEIRVRAQRGEGLPLAHLNTLLSRAR